MNWKLKKLIKCFIPYGFIVLRRKIINGKNPFIKFAAINRNEINNYLCNTTIKQLMDSNNLFQVRREGYEHPIYLRNGMSDIGVYNEVIEKNEYDFTVKNAPKYIIDAGANIGLASVYFGRKYSNAKIIAIEPEEENFKLLKLNIKDYPNITAINAALWNMSGEITLFDVGLDSGGFMVETNVSALKPNIKNKKHLVKSVTIDEIMNQFNIDSIDILKMDIEGAEKEVFESCKEWINQTKCIIIELHERMKKGCNKAFFKNIKLFDHIGIHGEDIYLTKENFIKMVL